MAEEEIAEPVRPGFPTARVKKILKLDKDINKVNPEALFLITCSADLFLRFLVGKSVEIVAEKKRRTLKIEHLRMAAKRHRPTSDFLLDSLPIPTESLDRLVTDRAHSRPTTEKPVPAGTRRIDSFFRKSEKEAPVQINDS